MSRLADTILAILVVAVAALSTGCGHVTAHVRTSPRPARVYSCFTIKSSGPSGDGNTYGQGISCAGTAPVTVSGMQPSGEYEFAACDGARIVWRRVSRPIDGQEIALDLDGPDAHPISKIEACVLKNQVAIGMTVDDVRRSWGPPHRKLESISAAGKHELWTWDYSTYDQYHSRTAVQTAFFTNGVVASVDTHGGGVSPGISRESAVNEPAHLSHGVAMTYGQSIFPT